MDSKKKTQSAKKTEAKPNTQDDMSLEDRITKRATVKTYGIDNVSSFN